MSIQTQEQFWFDHLGSAEAPLIHLLPPMFLDLEAIERSSSARGFEFFLINEREIDSLPALMDAFAKAMEMPAYFGRNWDALLDLTTDLSWKEAAGYVLVILNADTILSLAKHDLSALLEVLEATVRYWRDERGEFGERSEPLPFHILLSGTPALREILLSQFRESVCEHETELTVRIVQPPAILRDNDNFRDAQKLMQGGADLELVLSLLRERGVDKLNSTYAIAGLMRKSFSEAKSLVDVSQIWSDRYDREENFRNAARDALRDLGLDV
jgi:hypothetical protein